MTTFLKRIEKNIKFKTCRKLVILSNRRFMEIESRVLVVDKWIYSIFSEFPYKGFNWVEVLLLGWNKK